LNQSTKSKWGWNDRSRDRREKKKRKPTTIPISGPRMRDADPDRTQRRQAKGAGRKRHDNVVFMPGKYVFPAAASTSRTTAFPSRRDSKALKII